ncbi:hypothetical protein NC651_021696 [Populus alba x Populus x berolinensis]|nr:hypothetical protein NC651_021696 [Populus alba x Populus x berolinensis]
MEASKDKITVVMDLFVNKLDWESSVLMAFSLEKRLFFWATGVYGIAVVVLKKSSDTKDFWQICC